MKKILVILCFLCAQSIVSKATCYHLCGPDGNLYLINTDPENPNNTTAELIGNECEGGPWIHECPAVAGPIDQDATDIMLQFNPANLRPITAELRAWFEIELNKGNVVVTYLDLKRLPQATIDFLRTH